MNRLRVWIPSFLLSLFLIGSPAQAAGDAVGRVIVAVGTVMAVDVAGVERPLSRRAEVFEGETLVTRGADARMQVRFTDGSLVALRPDTEFRVDQYRFAGDAPQAEDSAVYNLLKGGMRTITGAIGREKDRDEYAVNTPMGTIGIRGTHYALQVCGPDCAGREGREQGLYGGVLGGRIAVTNNSGETTHGDDQYFHVASYDSIPRRLLAPPTFLINDIRAPEEEGEAGQATNGGAPEEGTTETAESGEDGSLDDTLTTESATATTTTTTVTGSSTTSESTATATDTTYLTTETTDASGDTLLSTRRSAPIGAAVGIGFVENGVFGKMGTGGNFYAGTDMKLTLDTVDGIGNIPVYAEVHFDADPDDPHDTGCNPCTFSRGTATLTDTGGFSGDAGVNWGRWAGGYVVTQNGTVMPTLGSFSYVYSEAATPMNLILTPSEIVGRVGASTASYNWAGGPRFVDETGALSTSVAGTIYVDFANQMFIDGANDYLSVAMSNGRQFNLDIDMASDANRSFAGVLGNDQSLEIIGSCSGCAVLGSDGTTPNNVDGNLFMTFLGPNAERIMGSFEIQEDCLNTGCGGGGSRVGLSGTAVFNR